MMKKMLACGGGGEMTAANEVLIRAYIGMESASSKSIHLLQL